MLKYNKKPYKATPALTTLSSTNAVFAESIHRPLWSPHLSFNDWSTHFLLGILHRGAGNQSRIANSWLGTKEERQLSFQTGDPTSTISAVYFVQKLGKLFPIFKSGSVSTHCFSLGFRQSKHVFWWFLRLDQLASECTPLIIHQIQIQHQIL